MTTDQLRDLLLEARRYAKVRPDVAVKYASEAADALEAAGYEGLVGSRRECLYRLADNVREGMRFVLVAPEVFQGYCDGARFELTCGHAGASC